MLTLVAWLCTILPLLSLLYFSAEVLAGLRPLGRWTVAGSKPRVTILIPAHDEAVIIADTLQALQGAIAAETRIIVIADNCSDNTAEIARSEGAEVLERHDPTRCGKGFALAFARDRLSVAPPQAVFVLDADCRVHSGCVEEMCAYVLSRGAPAQASNLLSSPRDCSALVLLSNFAMLMKNLVRARGLYRMSGGATLFGTGMAFPWHLFARLRLDTPEAVEDLSLSLDLAASGIKVHLYENLSITSPAAGLNDSLGQRRRWEHGFLAHGARYGVPFLVRGVTDGSRHLTLQGAHLLVPPVALLLFLAVVMLAVAGILTVFGASPWPVASLFAGIALALTSIAIAWVAAGRSTIPLKALALAPFYVGWKIPLYIAFIFARHTDWNRTRRANEET